ncbi:Arogenate dehydratase/prephenate dehydratase 2, chloroplastic [Dichanthelium oligosanthes]|uniref:Arogenate dehydratase n=1 Tax=Dichanthelium oligosanthes TaxID=888268 RepID=A0A1E5W9I3_9POAL|nr:Arogenate dehydratase/prephenate dehydratase 2, chloroplastic [Dichanthelium oligosanthes]
MAPAACLRLHFLPARARGLSAKPAATSLSPRRTSLKCSAANGDSSNPSSSSISISPSSPPRATVADGVESVDVNGLRRPPAPVSALTVPGARDPHWLPRKSRGRGDAWGCPGAYSEAAARKAYPNCETVPCEHFDTAFQAVQNWVADRAVLPLENSLGGSIHRNYDLLLRHSLHIVGEVRLAVRHCLLANPGVKVENLKSAMSHPQALAQCEHTLTELGIEHREAVDDTAGAAKFVAEQMLQDTGAIASSLAAKLYGLDVLAENIQDDKDNVTRFMMLAREPIIPRTDKPFKTSIVFSLEEGPGQLFKALAVFALREINLTKIESRPHKERPLRVSDDCLLKNFDYLFYVDLEASMADPKTQNALGNLKVLLLG